ncbi:MAG: tetratricopeptide repeat protein [Acidobacteria bacterium]|nr:tetratricopeptide repeat protein [Acidobacteriota bacterium]
MSKRSRRAERPPTAHAPVADTPSSWQPLVVVFLVALALRLLVAGEIWDLPLVRTPRLDSAEYLSWARRLAAGDFAWPIVSPHGPGYPFFLATLLVLGSGSLKTAIAVQALGGAVTAVMTAAIAREWFGLRVGIAAGIAYAIYGPAVWAETQVVSEGLLLFLLTFSALMLCREPITRQRVALAGLALGLATLVRPTAVAFLLAYGLWLLVRRARAAAAVLATVSVLTVAPAIAKTWSVSRSLSVQGYGGLNVYIGNSPLHDGRPTFRLGAGWDALNAAAVRAGAADPAAQDRYYLEQTIAEVRQHPAAFARLLGAKLLWLVQGEEVRDSHSFYFFADRAPVLRVLPRWALLFPLACAGVMVLVTARLKPRPAAERTASLQAGGQLLLVSAAAAVTTTEFLVVGTRYRLPIVPALAIAAGVGTVALFESVTARRVRDVVHSGAAIVAAAVVSHLLTDARHLNLAEEWALTGSSLITEHNLPEAESAYRRAVELDPRSGLAWDGLGLVQYDAGRLPEARQSLSRAIALGENAHALFHLALVDDREGKLAAAATGYRRAVDLSPDDADMTRHLATALGMLGRSAEALTQMRRVVQLDPVNGDAWLDVCLLSLDAHDVAGAIDALQRSRELGADPRRLAFAANALDRARR